MSKKPSVETGLDARRRQLLKLAGATVAVGGLGLKVGLANASEDAGQDSDVIDVAIIGGGLAGLTAIPRELYAAAEVDGAKSAFDRFRLVTWPMLGPTTLFVITISIINAVKPVGLDRFQSHQS